MTITNSNAERHSTIPFTKLTEIGSARIISLLRETHEKIQFHATDTRVGREVLVTLLPSLRLPTSIPLRDSANILRMRSSEVSRFKHPNVLSVFDAGECQAAPYVVHEFIDGPNLRDLMAERGPLGFAPLIGVLVRIAAALDSAHNKNVFHGALTSDSILIDRSAQAFISDLGIEYILQPLMAMRVEHSEKELCFHTAYQPGERHNSTKLDRKGDIYSFGVLAFEALTGQLPFFGDTAQEVRGNIISNIRLTATELIPGLSSEVDVAFSKVLNANPKYRFDTAHEFVCALASALGIEPLTLNFSQSSQAADHPKEAPPAREQKAETIQATPKSEYDFATFENRGEKPKLAPRPGASFEHARGKLESSVKLGPSGKGLFIGGCVLFLIAGLIAATILSVDRTQSAEQAAPVVAIEEAVAGGEMPVKFSLPGIENLESPLLVNVPANTPVEALTAKQLASLLWRNEESPLTIIEALHSAESRHLVDIASAIAQPLHNKSPRVRAEAARVAGAFADKRIVPFLMVLLDDAEPTVKIETARALGLLGERRSLPFIASRYAIEKNSEVRLAIKTAIDKISGYSVSEAELLGLSKQ